jgi:Carbohydrate binding module (family 6)
VNNFGEIINTAEASVTVVTPPPHIEPDNYTSQSGIQTETCSDVGGTLDAGFINNGDWCSYNGVNFGASTFSLSARVAIAGSGGNIEVRPGTTNGPLAGVIAVPVTGGWQTWITVSGALTNLSRNHTVEQQSRGLRSCDALVAKR